MSTLETRLAAQLVEAGTDVKELRLRVGVLTSLDTDTQASIVAAINELVAAVDTLTAGGSASTLDDLLDVVVSAVASGQVLRYDGAHFVNVDPTTYLQPRSASLDSVAARTPTSYGLDLVELANQAGLMGKMRAASSTVTGTQENSDDTEALAMSATDRTLTPGNLAAVRGVAGGLAGLDGGGKVPAAQLPAYVDDVLEAANLAAFPGAGATGVIYVALDTNKTYRWSGSAYVEISPSPGSTDAVTEGSTNLYFTNARADTRADGRITALIGDPNTDLLAIYTTARDT